VSEKSLYSMLSIALSQCRDLRMDVIVTYSSQVWNGQQRQRRYQLSDAVVLHSITRKLCYRKDDRAMRAI